MKAVQNLPIVLKLLVPLILMGGLTIGTSLYALSQMRTVGVQYQDLLQRETQAAKQILRANETAAHIGRLAFMMVAEPDSFIIESMADEIGLKRQEFLDLLAAAETLVPDLKEELDGTRTDFAAMMDLAEKARLTILEGQTERGARVLVDEFEIKLTDVLDRMVVVTKDVDESQTAGQAAAMARYERAWWVTLAVGITGTLLFLGLAQWLAGLREAGRLRLAGLQAGIAAFAAAAAATAPPQQLLPDGNAAGAPNSAPWRRRRKRKRRWPCRAWPGSSRRRWTPLSAPSPPPLAACATRRKT